MVLNGLPHLSQFWYSILSSLVLKSLFALYKVLKDVVFCRLSQYTCTLAESGISARYMQYSGCATNHYIWCNNQNANFLTYFVLNNIYEIKIPPILSLLTNNQLARRAHELKSLPILFLIGRMFY